MKDNADQWSLSCADRRSRVKLRSGLSGESGMIRRRHFRHIRRNIPPKPTFRHGMGFAAGDENGYLVMKLSIQTLFTCPIGALSGICSSGHLILFFTALEPRWRAPALASSARCATLAGRRGGFKMGGIVRRRRGGFLPAFRKNGTRTATQAATPTTRDVWLDDLRIPVANGRAPEVTLVVDSCYSGQMVEDCKLIEEELAGK